MVYALQVWIFPEYCLRRLTFLQSPKIYLAVDRKSAKNAWQNVTRSLKQCFAGPAAWGYIQFADQAAPEFVGGYLSLTAMVFFINTTGARDSCWWKTRDNG